MVKYKKDIHKYKSMKVLVITVFSLLFLSGLVIAVTNGISKNATLNQEDNNILNSLNNDSIMRGNITCDETKCWQRMWKGDYNLGTTTINKFKCDNYRLYNPEDNSTTNFNKLDSLIDILLENINSTNPIEYEYNCTLMKELKDEKLIEEMTKQQEKDLEEIAKTIIKRRAGNNETVIEDFGEIIVEVAP